MTEYLKEAQIHEALQKAEVRETAHDEFIAEFRNGMFTDATLPEWLADRKKNTPHRFVGMGDNDAAVELARDAFLHGRVDAQAQYLKRYGIADATQAAQRYGNPFPALVGKPGKETNEQRVANKDKAPKGKNPFATGDTKEQARVVAMLRKVHGDAEGLKRARAMAKDHSLVA
jgi:hypothetical protein